VERHVVEELLLRGISRRRRARLLERWTDIAGALGA